MTDQEINAAIAEHCGYYYMDSVWHYPNGGECDKFPDYCNDLNAMHEAEGILSSKHNPCSGESQWRGYLGWLGYCGEDNTSEVFQCVHATARERAEAFLRTIGKWKEHK